MSGRYAIMMEVDAATDDSDATIADEEDTPSAPESLRFPSLDCVGSSSQLSMAPPSAQAAQCHEAHAQAAQLTQSSSRASDGEDTGPVSPSLLSGSKVGHERNR
jgi:hypothetical protein